MGSYLASFPGKVSDFESTVMPSVRSWLKDAAMEEGLSTDSHVAVIVCNCPAMGILSAARINYILNFITNVLADFQVNGICLLVKPNRAGQEGRTGAFKNCIHMLQSANSCSLTLCPDNHVHWPKHVLVLVSTTFVKGFCLFSRKHVSISTGIKVGRKVEKTEKDQSKEEPNEKVKKDEQSEDDNDLDEAVSKKEEAESVEVRDVSYNLENHDGI